MRVDYYECADGHSSSTINGSLVISDRPIIGYKEAIKKGLNRYFTGVPCVSGHISDHLVTGCCVQCKNIADAKRKKVRRCKQPVEVNLATMYLMGTPLPARHNKTY
jgi:hypothetical protein